MKETIEELLYKLFGATEKQIKEILELERKPLSSGPSEPFIVVGEFTPDTPKLDEKELEASKTWALAAKRVGQCMTHYEGKMGDPNGCLAGLAAEFSANAKGDGPDRNNELDDY
jgi:hypothetical protein